MSSTTRIVLCAAIALMFLIATTRNSTADTYKALESSFSLPSTPGNPFDYLQNDVQVTFAIPGGKQVGVPAFFDGSSTWRVRYTPRSTGKYTISRVERNGAAVQGVVPTPREFTVAGAPQPGFIRVNPANSLKFAFDNGAPYFPLGNDAPWSAGANADVADFFAKMGAAGENWSRVWMCHWDGKNLDWPRPKEGEGYLSLTAARRWDSIVEAAEKNGIYFQLTLQHHGQYATMVDPNWSENPWNRKNGGFLDTPEQFFTDEHAKALTKAKYRYIIARYGYSPNIMAWELFNEVEGTDAGRKQQYAPIAAWHKEMAAFLRAQDPNHHLITTSSEFRITGLYDSMDYFQPHSYSPDPMAAIAGIKPAEYGKPVFLGEIGPGRGGQSDADFVTTILWTSIMSDSSGAAQYWFWDRMIRQNLFERYAAASTFLKESGQTLQKDLKSTRPEVETKEQGSYSFGPGGGWGNAAKTRFEISGNEPVADAGAMPAFFQGKAHRDMFPSLEFDVNYTVPGDFAVSVGNVAKSGAALAVLVDGRLAADHEFAAADKDTFANVTLHAAVPVGAHKITLQNSGADWVSITRFTLKPYGPAVHALARQGNDFAAAWVYRSDDADASSRRYVPVWMVLTGLSKGDYEIKFWNTERGGEAGTGNASVGDDGRIKLGIPLDGKSIAVYLRKR